MLRIRADASFARGAGLPVPPRIRDHQPHLPPLSRRLLKFTHQDVRSPNFCLLPTSSYLGPSSSSIWGINSMGAIAFSISRFKPRLRAVLTLRGQVVPRVIPLPLLIAINPPNDGLQPITSC